ncbi:MAG: hypothetical protein ACI9WS_002032 [Paraglaciecola psychrophila]|jgi:hypothetical protein
MKSYSFHLKALAAAIAVIGGSATPSFAQDESIIEEVVTIGTRSKPRSVTD